CQVGAIDCMQQLQHNATQEARMPKSTREHTNRAEPDALAALPPPNARRQRRARGLTKRELEQASTIAKDLWLSDETPERGGGRGRWARGKDQQERFEELLFPLLPERQVVRHPSRPIQPGGTGRPPHT